METKDGAEKEAEDDGETINGGDGHGDIVYWRILELMECDVQGEGGVQIGEEDDDGDRIMSPEELLISMK